MIVGVARVAWGVMVVVLLLAGAVAGDSSVDLALLPVVVAFWAVGLVLTFRRPRNAVGWLFGGLAVVNAELYFAQTYAAAAKSPWAAWFGTWPIALVSALLLLSIVCFPDGRLPSRRWRLPVGLLLAVIAFDVTVSALGDGLFSRNYPALRDPVRLIPDPVGHTLHGALEPVQLLGFLLAGAAVVLRFRRARGPERLQLKWFAFIAGTSAVAFAVLATLPLGIQPVVAFDAFAPLLPIAVGVAILRHRLYDLDRLVSRTVSYAVLTGLLVGIYAGLVTLATRALPFSSSFAVAVSTLAAAALFHPLRRRVQSVVDRRFNRARYDAERTLETLRSRLRLAVDPDVIAQELLVAVTATLEPAAVSLWIVHPTGPA
ncbi:MAG: hypothetical protein NVSMB13_07370 [Mycobacteriales bacterium]